MLIKVNAHYQEFDIYCGRPRFDRRWQLVGSPLQNPHKVPQGNKSPVDLYRLHLWAEIKRRNPAVIDELLTISGFNQVHGDCRLACWCAPKACHVDVIIAALQSSAVAAILDEEILKRGIKL